MAGSGSPPPGTPMKIPELPGRWQVWSKAADQPGAVFAVPADDTARASGIKYAVVKSIQKATEGLPTVSLIRTDPPKELRR